METLLKEIVVSARLRPLSALRLASGPELWDIVIVGLGRIGEGVTPHLTRLFRTISITRFMEVLELFSALTWATLTEEEVCTTIRTLLFY